MSFFTMRQRLASLRDVEAKLSRAHRMTCSDPLDRTRRSLYSDGFEAIGMLLDALDDLAGEMEDAETCQQAVNPDGRTTLDVNDIIGTLVDHLYDPETIDRTLL